MKKSNLLLHGLFFIVLMPSLFAQSQALNGQIEGTISDQTGAAVEGATIIATNIETGATRNIQTAESGVYRFPLLPLGTYRISAEAEGFKKFVRERIILEVGQIVTIDIKLEIGDINLVITVEEESSVVDAGKTDLSRVMNNREAQNLPNISRNAYNLGLLQTNVTGRPSRGFPTSNINVNGFLRRVNYQFDGNTNTTYHNRFRLFTMSEIYVSEVQLVTNGFAAEFGDTPGMVMNVVTPSGTNNLSGSISYRFRRPSFYSRPFFYPSAEDIPDNRADIFTATFGAPLIKNRWHFYFGFESQRRDDKSGAVRLLTITPQNRADLIAAGLSPSIFPPAIPTVERGKFYIFRTDLQINDKNRLSTRFNFGDINSENFIQGRFNTLDRSADSAGNDFGIAVQLASYTANFFNEFRFQLGERRNGFIRNEYSSETPTITIPLEINLGAPFNADKVLPKFRTTQFQNNLTRTFRTHIFKFGGGFTFHDYAERSTIYAEYIFTTVADYIAARNGSNRFSYESYEETFGNPEINYNATFLNFFAQDDWKVTRRLKINFGVRYDLYLIPKADATSLFFASQKFNVDKNNFAPRFGVVYALREGKRPTVLRFGAGIYTDAPLLAIYRDVNRFNGNPRFSTFSFLPTDAGAPAFPNTFGGVLPTGANLPPQDLIFTVASDFKSLYAMHFNVQIEQALTENLSLSAGFIYSAGRNLPVYRNINRINPVRFLSDGRPVFSSIVSPATRLDTRFNNIFMTEAAGVSRYQAFALQLRQRVSGGLQFSVNYTLSKATDDVPDADLEGAFLTDPTNRNLDKGYSTADQRHTFTMSLVYRPEFNFANRTLRYFLNNNQFGIVANANNGERFNIICACDLNRDGNFGFGNPDRPVGIKRNSGKTPPQFNLDFRYSRFFKFKERFTLEFFGEVQNLFNINSIVAYNNVSVRTITNLTTGELIGNLPDFKARNQSTSQESRQFQLGFKFMF